MNTSNYYINLQFIKKYFSLFDIRDELLTKREFNSPVINFSPYSENIIYTHALSCLLVHPGINLYPNI